MNDTFKNKWLHLGMLVLIYGTALATIGMQVFMLFPHTMAVTGMNMDHDTKTPIVIHKQYCNHIGPNHVIQITSSGFVPSEVTVQRCDQVTFTNEVNNAMFLPHFGEHPTDLTYEGFPQQVLYYNQSETFVAHTSGIFGFHDHLKDQIDGELIVK